MDNRQLEALARSLNELVNRHTFSVDWGKDCVLMTVPGGSEKREIDAEMVIELSEIARDWCGAKMRLEKDRILVTEAAGMVRSLEARFASKMSEAKYGATSFRIWQIVKPRENSESAEPLEEG